VTLRVTPGAGVVGGAGLPALMGVLAEAYRLETIVPTLLAAAVLQIVCYLAWSRYMSS